MARLRKQRFSLLPASTSVKSTLTQDAAPASACDDIAARGPLRNLPHAHPLEPAGDGIPGAPSLDDMSPEEIAQAQAMAAELAEARERLADTPSSMVVANHAMGLYELGAIHLSNNPPNLSEAKVAIDAMGAIVDVLPGRLGEHEETLQAARSQIQMAFVELSTQADEG